MSDVSPALTDANPLPLWKRKPLQLGMILLVLLGGVWGFSLLPTQSTGPIVLSGVLQAEDAKPSSLIGGRVARVLVEEGQQIRQGTPLVELEVDSVTLELRQAEARVAQAEAQVALLRAGTDSDELTQVREQVRQAETRLKQLKKGASQADRAQAKAQLTEARSAFAKAKQDAEQAQKALTQGVVAKIQVDEARQRLEAAEARLAASQAAYQQIQTGSEPEALSIAQSQVHALRASLHQARKGAKPQSIAAQLAQVKAAKAQLEALRLQEKEAVIKSPIDGTVNLLLVQPGDLVKAGNPVASIQATKTLWTEAFVPESLLPQLRVGQTVRVHPKVAPKHVVNGTLTLINPVGGFQSPDTPSHLRRDGETTYRVKVRLQPDAASQAKSVPLLAGMAVELDLPATPPQ